MVCGAVLQWGRNKTVAEWSFGKDLEDGTYGLQWGRNKTVAECYSGVIGICAA